MCIRDSRSDALARVVFVLVDGAFSDELRATLGDVHLMDAPVS